MRSKRFDDSFLFLSKFCDPFAVFVKDSHHRASRSYLSIGKKRHAKSTADLKVHHTIARDLGRTDEIVQILLIDSFLNQCVTDLKLVRGERVTLRIPSCTKFKFTIDVVKHDETPLHPGKFDRGIQNDFKRAIQVQVAMNS